MRLTQSRERPEKILVAMLRLAEGRTKPLRYEDIVVKAFEIFPDEFALRGYPQFPDSSDIHKPLYGVLKRRGLIRAANKTFALTPRGVEIASRLEEAAGRSIDEVRTGDRMSRDVEREVERMVGSDAFRLFVNGQKEKILDTDFYQFLGCTVRTPRNDFIGRISATGDAVGLANKLGRPDPRIAEDLANVWAFLQQQFKNIIDRQQGRK